MHCVVEIKAYCKRIRQHIKARVEVHEPNCVPYNDWTNKIKPKFELFFRQWGKRGLKQLGEYRT